jgi:S-methylmethionine-dependent homocysteine/selenocysteine methylase
MEEFRRRLAQPPPLLIDGAMGSELHRRGVDTRLPLWSAAALIDAPEVVAALHRDYVAAGAEVATADTFRTHRRTLAKSGRPERARDLAHLAVQLARAAAPRFVAGSRAPLEDCYEPRLVPPERECDAEHAELARDLADAGVDLLLVETMNTIREARAAARAARATGLPTVVSFVCGSDGRLLSGETVAAAATALLREGVDALAINCTPTATLHQPLQELLDAVAGRLPCGAYGNVGRTDAIHGFTCTEELDPDGYALRALGWVGQGARIVGGCCGTGPAHIAALQKALRAKG